MKLNLRSILKSRDCYQVAHTNVPVFKKFKLFLKNIGNERVRTDLIEKRSFLANDDLTVKLKNVKTLKSNETMTTSDSEEIQDLENLVSKGNIDELDPKNILSNSYLAGFIYDKEIDPLNDIAKENGQNGLWNVSSEILSDLAKDIGLSCVNNGNRSMIVDEKTGLTVTILINAQTKKICLCFGGTTSGQTGGKIVKRMLKNSDITMSQWKTNFKNIFSSKVPMAYQQAARLAMQLKIYTEDKASKWCLFQFENVGHSLGGGLATFAAAMAGSVNKPITATCFSSAQLGEAAIHAIYNQHEHNSKNLQAVFAKISHIRVQGDVVPLVSKLNVTTPIRGLKLLGKSYTIPASGKIDRHDNFRFHIKKWARAKGTP